MEPQDVIATLWWGGLPGSLSVIDIYFLKLTCKRLHSAVGDINRLFLPRLKETIENSLLVKQPTTDVLMGTFRPGSTVLSGSAVLQAILGESWGADVDVFSYDGISARENADQAPHAPYAPPLEAGGECCDAFMMRRNLSNVHKSWRDILADAFSMGPVFRIEYHGDIGVEYPKGGDGDNRLAEHAGGPCYDPGRACCVRARGRRVSAPGSCQEISLPGPQFEVLRAASVRCFSADTVVYPKESRPVSLHQMHYRYGTRVDDIMTVKKADFIGFTGVPLKSRGKRELLQRVLGCVDFDPCASVWDGENLIMYDPTSIAKRCLFGRSLRDGGSRGDRATTEDRLLLYTLKRGFSLRLTEAT